MKRTKFARIIGIVAVIMLIGSQMAVSAFAGTLQKTNYKEQSKDVTSKVTVVTKGSSKYIEKIIAEFNIGSKAAGDQVIELSKMFEKLDDYSTMQPGDRYPVEVKITNSSAHSYQYKDGSFELATINTSGMKNLTDFVDKDGQRLPIEFVGSLAKSKPILALFDATSASLSVDQICGIYKQLESKGFTGDEALTDYILDYYKVSSIDELTTKDKIEIQGGMAAPQFTVSPDKLNTLANNSEYQKVMNYALAIKDGANYRLHLKWPEKELALLSYDLFYDSLFSFAYGQDNVQKLKGSNKIALDMAVRDYQDGTKPIWDQTNNFFNKLTGAGNSETEFDMLITLDGLINNAYQDYQLSAYNTITMEQTDVQHYKTGKIKVTKKVTENDKPYQLDTTFYAGLFEDQDYTKPVKDADGKAIIIPLNLDGKDSVTVTKDQIPLGDFYVAETDIDGKALKSSDGLEITIDHSKITVTESAVPEVTITNAYKNQYYMTGQVEITKKVTENGKPYQVNTTFYAGLFDDADYTKPTKDADGNPIIIPLELKNQDTVTVTKDQIPYGKFYVAETDKDGNAVKSGNGLKVAIDNTEINVAAGNTPKVVITNDYSDYEGFYNENDGNTTNTTTTGTSSTTKTDVSGSDAGSAVQTGDDSSMMPYILLLVMAAAAVVAVVAVGRNKKQGSKDKE